MILHMGKAAISSARRKNFSQIDSLVVQKDR